MAAIVGSGDYRYEIVESWPKMPKYWNFGGPSGAAVNSDDEVYVFSRGIHPVTIWDTDGNFISSWGEGEFDLRGPHGIHVAPDDHVWLTDMYEHVVTKHAPGGERLLELGMRLMPSPAWDARPFNMPTGVASMPDGGVVVSDGYGGHRVHRFDADGNLRAVVGRAGQRARAVRAAAQRRRRRPGPDIRLRPRGGPHPDLRRGRRVHRGVDRSRRPERPVDRRRGLRRRAARATRTQHLDARRRAHHALARGQRPGRGRVHVVPRRVRGLAGEHLRHRAGPRQGGEAAAGVAGRRARWPGLPNVDPNGVRGLGRGVASTLPPLAGGS